MPMTESRRRRLHSKSKLKGHKLTHAQLLEVDKRSAQNYCGRVVGVTDPSGVVHQRMRDPPRQPPTRIELGLTLRDLAKRLAVGCPQGVTWRDLWAYQKFRLSAGFMQNQCSSDQYHMDELFWAQKNGNYLASDSYFDWDGGGATALDWNGLPAPLMDYETASAAWYIEHYVKLQKSRCWRRPPKHTNPQPQRSSPSQWEPSWLMNGADFLDHPCARTDRWKTQRRAAWVKQHGKAIPAKDDWLATNPPNHLPYMKRYCLRVEHKRTVAEWRAWLEELPGHWPLGSSRTNKAKPAWEAMIQHYLHADTEDVLDSEFWDWAASRKQWLKPDKCEAVEYSEC